MSSSESSVEGRVALVTGASSGIGEATAETLAAEGANVALAARSEDELQDLANGLETDHGVETVVVPTDMTERAQIEELIDQTVDSLGSLDILVNNAGVMLLEPTERASLDNYQQSIELNLLGLMTATRLALPALREGDGGTVINISSVAGRVAHAGSGAYSASKFGVGAFSEVLREEMAGEGVRVSVIEPGAVDTALPDHITDDEAREQSQQMYESLDMLRPEDIADAIRYIVTRPERVGINELVVRPRDQDTP
jgi:NADP-dependent 3-hydroxy acid dehydrogenase YdfG